MKKLGSIMAATGKYTGRDGQEKTSWTRCGALFEKEPGKYTVKWEATPAGNQWEGWCPVFEDKPKSSAATAPREASPTPEDEWDDAIPF